MMKKFIFIGLGVIVLGGLVYLNMIQKTGKVLEVTAEIASTRDIIETVSASGRIQPATKVDITSQVNGEIISLPISEGQSVEAGQVLVVLDTIQLKSDVDQAHFSVQELNARLDGAKSLLDQTREEYDRQKSLYAKDLTSETALTNAKYAYLDAKARYEANLAQAAQAQARYEKQLDNLSKATIVAPMSGIITFLDCEAGEIAAAQTAFTQGRTLMTISDLDLFEVEVEVDETEINKVELGQDVSIEVDAFPDTTFAGTVVEIGNTAISQGVGTQDQSTNFRVKVIFKDSNVRIRPGMSATVDVTTASTTEALSVPFSAVVMRSLDLDSLEAARKSEEEGEQSGVGSVQAAETTDEAEVNLEDGEKDRKDIKGIFVIREGKARFVEIETGIADQKHIEITSGLNLSDSVIAGPYRVLRNVNDGDEVVPKKKDKAGKK